MTRPDEYPYYIPDGNHQMTTQIVTPHYILYAIQDDNPDCNPDDNTVDNQDNIGNNPDDNVT
jgi:hypothetical protein